MGNPGSMSKTRKILLALGIGFGGLLLLLVAILLLLLHLFRSYELLWFERGPGTDTETPFALPATRPGTQLRPGERRLPDGFLAIEQSDLDPIGWPLQIVSMKDKAIMVFVPAGEFVSGLTEEQIDALANLDHKIAPMDDCSPYRLKDIRSEIREGMRPAARVRLGAFYIDKYEVSNRQYRCFMAEQEASNHHPGILLRGGGMNVWDNEVRGFYDLWADPKRSHDAQPVTCVSGEDAAAFAAWAGKSLPTYLQWERAAVGDGNRLFPWGSYPLRGVCRCDVSTIREKFFWASIPATVGFYKLDISPFGCNDMGGNVSEWVLGEDVFRPNFRVKGGSAASFWMRQICSAMSDYAEGGKEIGFRTVLCVEGTETSGSGP